MHFYTRPLIALVAAYGILLAALLSAVSAGSTVAFGAPSVCHTADAASEPAPISPVRHDLECCVGCCNAPPALLIGAAADAAKITFGSIAWAVTPANFSHASVLGSPFARAPPALF